MGLASKRLPCATGITEMLGADDEQVLRIIHDAKDTKDFDFWYCRSPGIFFKPSFGAPILPLGKGNAERRPHKRNTETAKRADSKHATNSASLPSLANKAS